MGIVYAEIELINSVDVENAKCYRIGQEEIRRMRLEMLVDSGAYMMAINETIQSQLEIPFLEKRKVQLASGQVVEYDVVGLSRSGLLTEGLYVPRSCCRVTVNLYWAPFRWRKWMS
jgi:hypothetical protein